MEAGSSNDVSDKFKLVLNGLLNQDYIVTNDVYFEMFITHLSGKGGEGMLLSLLSFPPCFNYSDTFIEMKDDRVHCVDI